MLLSQAIRALFGLFIGSMIDRTRTYGSGGINPLQKPLRQTKVVERTLMQMTDDDDLMLLSEDDADVHLATEFSLKHVIIHRRPLRFTHANSGAEAVSLLERLDDVHLLLLDMVMERPDAGLEVARWLHEVAGRRELPTIVLRSGQPGTLARSAVLGNPTSMPSSKSKTPPAKRWSGCCHSISGLEPETQHIRAQVVLSILQSG